MARVSPVPALVSRNEPTDLLFQARQVRNIFTHGPVDLYNHTSEPPVGDGIKRLERVRQSETPFQSNLGVLALA